jgi:small subunit ribosomal protein S13
VRLNCSQSAECLKTKKSRTWTDDEVGAVRNAIATGFKVEGELRSEVQSAHQAFDGHWKPPWHPPQKQLATSWTAHQEQLSHPKGKRKTVANKKK